MRLGMLGHMENEVCGWGHWTSHYLFHHRAWLDSFFDIVLLHPTSNRRHEYRDLGKEVKDEDKLLCICVAFILTMLFLLTVEGIK